MYPSLSEATTTQPLTKHRIHNPKHKHARTRKKYARTRQTHLTMHHIQLIIQEVMQTAHHNHQQENNMINDVTVYVTYTDLRGEPQQIELTLTGKQIESTMQRRMQTLVPTAKSIQFHTSRPTSQQLEIKKGAK